MPRPVASPNSSLNLYGIEFRYEGGRWGMPAEFEVAHLTPKDRQDVRDLLPYLNRYPPAISERSRVKTAGAFLGSGHRALSESKYVRAFRYHRFSKRLYVEFKKGGLGYYQNVPIVVAAKFFTANSHGVFLHSQLKGHFYWVSLRG